MGQLQEVQHSHHRGATRTREKQETGYLFEKLMKENFPNLVKEIDMPIQKAQRVPNKMYVNRPTLRHIIIKMPKVKDKERTLKIAREKQLFTYKGVPIDCQLISQRQLSMRSNVHAK